MDIKLNFRTIDLFLKLANRRTEEISFVSYQPQKQAFCPATPYLQPFPRSTPEEQGISSGYLYDFFQELQETPITALHSIMLLRNGHVIAEGSFSPYKQEVWHISHSLCKSIVALAVGIAIAEGRFAIDDKVVDLLSGGKRNLTMLHKKNMTVRHLLTMSSGIAVNEVGAVTGNDWTKQCLESGPRFEPGTKFHYNSMNTYLLSVILHKTTGEDLLAYLKPRLFEPMGIDRVFWERSPEGVIKGGFGMYLCIEDMAKFGQLYLQEGMWNGEQLVPRDWIREATSYQIDSTAGNGKYGYGYQVWLCERAGSYQFNGMLGQIVMVLPDLNMVLVTTGGNVELHRDCTTTFLLEKYFGSAFAPQEHLRANRRAQTRLASLLSDLHYEYGPAFMAKLKLAEAELVAEQPDSGAALRQYQAQEKALFWEQACRYLHGRCYRPEKENVGLLPIFVQCIHNNYTTGIQRFSFTREKEQLYLTITEEQNVNRLCIGFSVPAYTVVQENGEGFAAAVTGDFSIDTEGLLVLKVTVSLIETTNTRIFRFIFDQTRTWIKYNETPGIELIVNGISSVSNLAAVGAVVSTAVSKIDEEYLQYKIKAVMEPEMQLFPVEETKVEAADVNGGGAKRSASRKRATGEHERK